MRPYLTAGLALLLAGVGIPGCAGGSARSDAAGAGPIDTVHIRAGDTLPPVNPSPAPGATQPADSAPHTGPGQAQQDSTSGMSSQPRIDTSRTDSTRGDTAAAR